MTFDVRCSAPLRRRLVLALPAWAAAAFGCASDREKIDAIGAVNQGFRLEYEKLLAEKGARVFPVARSDAFVAMRVALAGLGMRTEQQDVTLGHLAVAAPAPLPLTDDEWRRASEADLPFMRRLIAPHVGAAANFVQFEPQGLAVVINATFLDAPNGTEVALTVRLRELAPPRSGWPRREYVAPHLLTAGLDKIFASFDRELRAAARR
jgi:hypothetical protein